MEKMQLRLKNITKLLLGAVPNSKTKSPITERELKIAEGEIGAAIFGPLEPNERRVFFNDNRESWFFHQEKIDSLKNRSTITLHYEVRPEGVMRVDTKNGLKCELISGQELKNFIEATEIYYKRVMSQIYNKNTNQSND